MVDHIDIAIVVAAERFSLPMWEYAAEYIVDCSVRIVTTRGGGGVDDMDMSMLAVARGFSKAIDTVMEWPPVIFSPWSATRHRSAQAVCP